MHLFWLHPLLSEISNNFTILGISGNVETDEPEMTLQISKDKIILFEDTLSIYDNLFETNTVLYDYVSNTPWSAGDYRVSGLIGEESFYSDVFRLDEQNLSVFEISKMDLFLYRQISFFQYSQDFPWDYNFD